MREVPTVIWVFLPLFLLFFVSYVSSSGDDSPRFPQGWLRNHERHADAPRESDKVKTRSLKQLNALRSYLSEGSVLVVVFSGLDSSENHGEISSLPGKALLEETSEILADNHISFVDIPISPSQLPIHTLGVEQADTILVFTHTQITKFHGLHQPDALVSFLHRLRAPPVTYITEKKQKKALKRTDGIKFEGYFTPDSSGLDVFTQVAKSFHPYVPFYAVFEEEVATHLKLESLGSVNVWHPCCKNPHLIEKIKYPEEFTLEVNKALRSPLKKLSTSDINAHWNYDSSKFTILAFVDRTTVHGFHFFRVIRKVMNKIKDAETLNVLWINIAEYPKFVSDWEQIFNSDLKTPQLGLVNLTDGNSKWINSKELQEFNMEKKIDTVGQWLRKVIRGGVRVDGIAVMELEDEEQWHVKEDADSTQEEDDNNGENEDDNGDTVTEKDESTQNINDDIDSQIKEEDESEKEKKIINSKYRKSETSVKQSHDKYKDKDEDEDKDENKDDEKDDEKDRDEDKDEKNKDGKEWKRREKDNYKKSQGRKEERKVSKKNFQKRQCDPNQPSADCSLFTWIWWFIKQILLYFRSLIFPAYNGTTVAVKVSPAADSSQKGSKPSLKPRPVPVPESVYPVPPGSDGDFFMSYDDEEDIGDMFDAVERSYHKENEDERETMKKYNSRHEGKRRKEYEDVRKNLKESEYKDYKHQEEFEDDTDNYDQDKHQRVKKKGRDEEKFDADEDDDDDFFVSYDDEEDISEMFEGQSKHQENDENGAREVKSYKKKDKENIRHNKEYKEDDDELKKRHKDKDDDEENEENADEEDNIKKKKVPTATLR